MKIVRNVSKDFVPFQKVLVGEVFGCLLSSTIFMRVREVSSSNFLGFNVLNFTTNELEYWSPETRVIPYPNAELFLSEVER